MNRPTLCRLLSLFAAFGTLSATSVPVAHGLAHVGPAVLTGVPQHTGPLVPGPGLSPAMPDTDHQALHGDCTLWQLRGRLVVISASAFVSSPAPVYSLPPARQEPVVEVVSPRPPTRLLSVVPA